MCYRKANFASSQTLGLTVLILQVHKQENTIVYSNLQLSGALCPNDSNRVDMTESDYEID